VNVRVLFPFDSEPESVAVDDCVGDGLGESLGLGAVDGLGDEFGPGTGNG
jgi:hypothetical protein